MRDRKGVCMKKGGILILGLLAVALALVLAGCPGPTVSLTARSGPGDDSSDEGGDVIGDEGDKVGLQSISIASPPTRTTYTVGDAFNSAGLVVTGTYDDDSIVTVTSGYTVTWDTDNKPLATGNTAITATAGAKTATVTWHGKSEYFLVNVNAADGHINVSDAATWTSAFNIISSDSPGTSTLWKSYRINISGSFSVPGSTSPRFTGEYKSVTLTGSGTVSLSSQGNLFRLESNQTLIIDSEDLTLQGMQGNNDPVVYLYFGTLELRNGTISGNTGYSGNGVYVNGGTFTMSGGKISGNGNYGVVVNSGIFTMSGGKISGNTNGGVIAGNTFSMSGGEISGNGNSGVFVVNGTFTMSGGKISGNTGSSGGGVYVSYGITFAKTGGVIYGYDSDDPSNPLWNKANQGDTWGHAVYYNRDASNQYYRDTTLAAGDNINTGTLPSLATGSYDATNWIKQP